MKVLHIINSLAPGGAERLVSELLPALDGIGVKTVLLAFDSRRDAFSSVLASHGIEATFAREKGACPYSPMRIFDIERSIRRYGPDIVHAHLGPCFHWCALSGFFHLGLPLVATEHATENNRMAMPFASGIERLLYRRYNRIAVVSSDTGAALRSWIGIPARKLTLVPNGISISRFGEVAAPAPDVVRYLDGRIGIAITARFVSAKDHCTAIRALSHLPSNYCLVLAGDGEEREHVRRLAADLNVSARCLFLGSRADIPSVFSACKAYLQTSRVEGFGIAALEAMAAGLPVVASDAPGLGELVRGAGILFPVGNDVVCADAVRRVIEEEGLAVELLRAGKARAMTFSIEKCAEKYLALYQSVLEEQV